MLKKLIITAILFAGITTTAWSQELENNDILRIHFVGNSYTYYNNMPQVLYAFAESRDIRLVTSKTVVGGAELREHWNNGSEDKPKWSINTREILEKGKYDIVILQDQSMMPVDYPDSIRVYVRLFTELLKEMGSEPVLYMTWARERIPQLQDQLTVIYAEAGRTHQIKVAPVGEAFRMARTLRPGMQLFADDGTHPSPEGSYLAACTFFAVITGEDPVGLTRRPKINDQFGESLVLMSLHREDAIFLQTVARDVVEVWTNQELKAHAK